MDGLVRVPILRHTPAGADLDAVFDVKAIYQQPFEEVDIARVPQLFTPRTGPLGLTDWEKVYAAGAERVDERRHLRRAGLSRHGVVVVVRPDQYVAAVLPLTATEELAAFFEQMSAAAAAAGCAR